MKILKFWTIAPGNVFMTHLTHKFTQSSPTFKCKRNLGVFNLVLIKIKREVEPYHSKYKLFYLVPVLKSERQFTCYKVTCIFVCADTWEINKHIGIASTGIAIQADAGARNINFPMHTSVRKIYNTPIRLNYRIL